MARTSYSSIHYDPTVEMFFHNDGYISTRCIAVGDYDYNRNGDLNYVSECASSFGSVATIKNRTKVLSKTSDNTYGFSSLVWLNATIDLKLSEI